MSYYSTPCGPDSTDNYYFDRGDTYCSHTIKGVGKVTGCKPLSYYSVKESYSISAGITELGDGCMNYSSITEIKLPKTLIKIGNYCFAKTRITSIGLPESLEKIGESNFPSSLIGLFIPPLITNFPLSNVRQCMDMSYIGVYENNTTYKSIDGVLYNSDLTEIIFCPNAKAGVVNIPSSVRKIGDYCFEKCRKLTKIIIPSSVESIGQYAFSGIKMEKLIIPDSVKTIGIGCFSNSEITTKFHFSDKIVNIPDFCFTFAKIPLEKYSFRWETIGKEAFNIYSGGNSLFGTIKLQNAKKIESNAFAYNKEITTIELFSSIEYVDAYAFNGLLSPTIKLYSFVPLFHPYAFLGMQVENATLVVPPHTKFIFQNVEPWSGFHEIVEIGLDKDVAGKKTTDVSTKDYLVRLSSVHYSLNNPNRPYLKEILERLFEEYSHVDSEEEFEEAMCLINYNKSFKPAIIPDLEQRICQKWDEKYKLKLLDNYMAQGLLEMHSNSMGADTLGLIGPSIALPVNINTPPAHLSDDIEKGNTTVLFSNILSCIQKELSKSEKTVQIAVSWFTNYSLFAQIKEMAENGIKIQLIINNDAINNGGYCLDFNLLIDAGVEISLVEFPHLLHHKFCIIDNSIVINGSYNWTRFSQSNYENVVIFRDNDSIVDAFYKEFCSVWANAEHKSINRMPETVPQRPEYDRYAFKQYITEELNAQAREISNERDKITVLHQAVNLNKDYLRLINPETFKANTEAFEVLKGSEEVAQDVLSMMGNQPKSNRGKVKASSVSRTKKNSSASSTRQSVATKDNTHSDPVGSGTMLKDDLQTIEALKTSSLYMVLDVSGSMMDTYNSGHVRNITLKALAAALTIAKTKEVAIWTFGDNAAFFGNVGLSNISEIGEIRCKNEGTNLYQFVNSASASMAEGSLVIIFTDDDGSSIQNALGGMKNRPNVFWQLIVYGKDYSNIANAIGGMSNASVVCLNDYASKSDKEINEILLKHYVSWKANKNE